MQSFRVWAAVWVPDDLHSLLKAVGMVHLMKVVGGCSKDVFFCGCRTPKLHYTSTFSYCYGHVTSNQEVTQYFVDWVGLQKPTVQQSSIKTF